MAASVNAIMAAGNNGNTHAVSSALGFTTAGITIGSISSSVLLACMNWGQSAGSTQPSVRVMTWNGVSMTEVPSSFQVTTSDPFASCVWFYLINPAAGAQNLIGGWAGVLDCYASAICFNGVEQTDATLAASFNAAIGSALTLNVTGTSSGATVATHIRNGSEPSGAGTGNTLFWNFDDFNPGGGGGYRLGLNGANTFDFNNGSNTGSVRATSGLHLVAASGGGGATPVPLLLMMGVGF